MKSEKIRVPARLKPGDSIGIVAPAGAFDDETFYRGTQILEKMGFEVFIPDGLSQPNGYLAGSDSHRAQLVNQLFADTSTDAIICARGGYGSIRILSLLDYEVIKNNSKVFIGFSDITALLSVFFNRCGLVTFHGPVVTSLAVGNKEDGRALFSAITSEDPLEIILTDGQTINPGSESGILCGGNLNTLCHLTGTPFAPNFNGKILFLEDRGEAPYRIDRMLVHMRLAGCFKDIAGVILGSFEECGSIEDIYKIVKDVFNDHPIPILAGLKAGHGKVNRTIPLGIEVTLDADEQKLSFHRAATAS
jgi:muramoyltetrapeptide carboxypeptidase